MLTPIPINTGASEPPKNLLYRQDNELHNKNAMPRESETI